MRLIRDVVELVGEMSGNGVSMTEIQVLSKNASNVRLLVIVRVLEVLSWNVLFVDSFKDSISIVRVHMIGDAPLPWSHPNRGLEGVDS